MVAESCVPIYMNPLSFGQWIQIYLGNYCALLQFMFMSSLKVSSNNYVYVNCPKAGYCVQAWALGV